jgi:4-carboxymuconolactone decarboxylase
MTRLPQFLPDDLDDEQRLLYDAITGGPRATGPRLFALTDDQGRLEGPFNAMLASPPVGSALQALGGAVRFGTELSDRIREMAILAVATKWDSPFERYAHEAVGRHVGLTETELDHLRAGTVPDLTDENEATALAVVTALLNVEDLDDSDFIRATKVLGERQVFELTTLVGYYATLALQLRVYRVAAP